MYALTAKAMRYMDEYTMKHGIPSAVLMENAARGVVDEVLKQYPDRDVKVLVLSGSGNNGGNALCTARWMMHLGFEVKIYFVGDVDRISKGFSQQLNILRQLYPDLFIPGYDDVENELEILQTEYDVIIDGIFGIGLNRRLGNNFAKFIEFMNAKSGNKIAIDIPSGLNATTGKSMGAVFNADITVTFANHKIGMFFGEGREACGEIRLVDIGIAPEGYSRLEDKLFICDNNFFENTVKNILLPRIEKSHKGTYGTVGIIAGSNSMLGASILAAKAAYRSGCGLVKIFCPNKCTGFFNVSIPEAVVVPYKTDDLIATLDDFISEIDVVALGPGLAENNTGKLLVKHILSKDVTAVLDAGALNIISTNLKQFKKRKCKCVITPHVGEMARLCNEETKIVEKNRVGFAKSFSKKYHVSIVLKSDISITSLLNDNGEQRMFLNTIGNSGLATAGSGDVLTGVVASLAAQGNTLNTSLLCGTMVHGMAAEKFATNEELKRKMMAGDIVENLFAL